VVYVSTAQPVEDAEQEPMLTLGITRHLILVALTIKMLFLSLKRKNLQGYKNQINLNEKR